MLDEILYWSGRTAMELYTRLMLRVDAQWHGPLPGEPKIIAANHPTTTDPFFITTLIPEPMSLLVTEVAFQVPVFGRYLREAGHVCAVAHSGGATLEALKRQLESGRSVAIFPEGALSPAAGSVHPPHTGVARLALSTGAPVIPVGIGLQWERIRAIDLDIGGQAEAGRLYLWGPYAITVGEPLRFEGDVEDRERVRAVADQVMRRIQQLAWESAWRIEAKQAQPIRPAAWVVARWMGNRA